MRRRTFLWAIASLAVLPALAAGPVLAKDDAAARGHQIAEEAERRARGVGDSRVEMVMILRDRRGKETRRELQAWTLEGVKVDKSLVTFESPRDIRGTALLSYSHRDGDDEQWLYLPALKRTKRIAASNRSSPFMGSEFSYEDLATSQIEDFSHRFLKEAELRGTRCYVVEQIPRYSGTGYSRQEVWLDQAEYRVMKIDYWDKRGRHLKTLSLGNYEKYEGKHWRPRAARMENHVTKDVTTLVWKDYRFGTGLDDSDFTQGALGRAK